MESIHNPSIGETGSEDRRGFFVKIAAAAVTILAGAIPFASGLLVFLDPLRRKSRESGFLRVATIDTVPDDGLARRFPVLAPRSDAWNRYPHEPIGAVYLRRVKGSGEVMAFNAICPHAGCFIDFNFDEKAFLCPCHDSRFSVDGSRVDPSASPSPRDMDKLEVDSDKLDHGEIWVNFKNFVTGTSEKRVR